MLGFARFTITRSARASTRSGCALLHVSSAARGSLDEDFQQHKQASTRLGDVDNATKLKLYALYKQATEGPCKAPKPGMFDIVGKAKWQAWTELAGLAQEEAKKQYISTVAQLQAQQGATRAQAAGSGAAAAPQAGEFTTIKYSVADNVASITLNRPEKMNAFSFDMYEEVVSAFQRAGADDGVHVALLTGAGDTYSAGNDLGNFAKIPAGGPEQLADEGKALLQRFVGAFIDFRKPLITAVNGPSIGIATTTLALCDIVFASHTATFHTPFSVLGLTPEACSSVTFPERMGVSMANEVLLGGRKLSAQEALEYRLVSRVVAHQDLRGEAQAYAATMAKLPPRALQLSKDLVMQPRRTRLHEVCKVECEVLRQRWLSQEAMDAVMRFMARKG